MYLLGHFALGYFLATALRRLNREDYSIPLIFIASVLPDLDFLFFPYLVHRGPTHSVLVMTVAFIPVYLYLRRGLPYYIALLSHSLIGDYTTSTGAQLFWPLTTKWYRAQGVLYLDHSMGTKVEYALFALLLLHILLSRRSE